MGRSTGFIICPFCGEEVEVYLWSVHGGGKKCPTCYDTIIYSRAARNRGCPTDKCQRKPGHKGDCSPYRIHVDYAKGVNLKKTKRRRAS